MVSWALHWKSPIIFTVAAIELGVADFLLVGLPGPCGISGALDGMFGRFGELQSWIGYGGILSALMGIVLGIVWLMAVAVVRLLEPKPSPASIDPEAATA